MLISSKLKFLALTFLITTLPACAANDSSAPKNGSDLNRPVELSIATWNVHNFFDTICDSGSCEKGDYEPQLTESEYKNKLNFVAAGVKRLNADIIMLQEIEKESLLQELLKGLPNYPFYVFGELGTTASVDVSIISRYPIIDIKLHRPETDFILPSTNTNKKLARELIEADIEVEDGLVVKVFTTHFVSKATDPSGERREIEAKITSQIIKAANDAQSDALIAFGGDLNDYPDSVPIATLHDEGNLINASVGTLSENATSWKHTARFDYIFHNENLASYHQDTTVECETTGTGFSDSDHCAVRSTYRF